VVQFLNENISMNIYAEIDGSSLVTSSYHRKKVFNVLLTDSERQTIFDF